jgi:acyl carrier protein
MIEMFNSIKKVISRHLELDVSEIKLEDSLYEQLGLDSTSIIDVLLEIERELQIELDFEEMEPSDLENIQSLINYLKKLSEGL